MGIDEEEEDKSYGSPRENLYTQHCFWNDENRQHCQNTGLDKKRKRVKMKEFAGILIDNHHCVKPMMMGEC